LATSFLSESVGSYSLKEAEISVVLSGDAYCDKDTYINRRWAGTVSGFVPTQVIYNQEWSTQGYIGYLPSNKSIYVVF
jgi:hypothetical protein